MNKYKWVKLTQWGVGKLMSNQLTVAQISASVCALTTIVGHDLCCIFRQPYSTEWEFRLEFDATSYIRVRQIALKEKNISNRNTDLIKENKQFIEFLDSVKCNEKLHLPCDENERNVKISISWHETERLAAASDT